MPQKIQVKRGVKANLPTLSVGEPAFTTDTKQVFVGDGTTNVELAKQTDLNTTNVNVTNLTTMIDASAEMIRDSIPSGFTQLSDIDYTYMSTNPNTIKLSSDSVAYVNGYKTKIPSGTVITLNAPPTTGTRDDLVFLECWKQTDVNGIITWNSRIRVVDGVDFTAYPLDGISVLTNPNGYINVPQYINPMIIAQGGSASPTSKVFQNYNQRLQSWGIGVAPTDTGLYISGTGSLSDKTTLNTTDGYVYAIPMFRIKRRNSGGYSVNNGNGGSVYTTITFVKGSYPTLYEGMIGQRTLSNGDYTKVEVGKNYYDNASKSYILQVISKDGNNLVTVRSIKGTHAGNDVGFVLMARPDYVFADIIDVRDIIDLRHQVSLTGFNNDSLLEENFNKLLRGELQTSCKTTMLKTYHGISKTPIDTNTVFYASLDGTTIAEVGGVPSINEASSFKLCPTGLGITKTSTSRTKYILTGLSQITDSTPMTIDTLLNVNVIDMTQQFLWVISNTNDTTGYMLNARINASGKLVINSYNDANGSITITYDSSLVVGKTYHIRVVLSMSLLKLYVNGISVGSYNSPYLRTDKTPVYLYVGSSETGISWIRNVISDLSISNIDRGATFTSLPQDFIDGYARIDDAFNTQRDVFSDALTSEVSLAQVKCVGGNTKEITVGDSSTWTKTDTTKWNSGDRIKVKGLGSEIISGIVDVDTAIAKVVQNATAPVTLLYLDDVSKFVVNDTIKVYDVNANNASLDATITAIDTVNKTITLSSPVNNGGNWNIWVNQLVIESTASSSIPLAKSNLTGTAQAGASSSITLASTFSATDNFYNGLTITITSGTGSGQVRTISSYVGSTKVATVSSAWTTTPDSTSVYLITGVSITGTWSGLGTNEITLTLGINNGLTNQDIWISYGLNENYGQGGISEVLTTTLGGESNGKKLVVNSSVHVRDDFAGKVVGDFTVCPNIGKNKLANSLQIPSSFISELDSSNYSKISSLDGTNIGISANSNGLIPQSLFSFNLIRIIEDKYGVLPCPNDIVSKVAWLRTNLAQIGINWYGYGSCPTGNKCYASIWSPTNNNWTTYSKTNTSNYSSALIFLMTNSQLQFYLDINGFIHVLSYTDASDGTTSSTIYTDYINIEIIMNTPTGYDVLSPENPRRDDGKANILLVRKETKEIQTMFPRGNADGIITYGDYVPYQFSSDSISRKLLCYMEKLWIISNGTGSPNIDFAPTKISARLPKYNGLLKVWDDYMLVNTDLVALNGINISDTGNLSSYFSPPKTTIFGKIVGDSNSIPNYRTGEYVNTLPAIYAENLKSPCPHLLVSCGLSKDNDGSLLMLIRTTFTRGNDCCSAGNGTTSVVGIIRLANRPLIK